MEDGF
jgi:hypothetical protein